MKFQTSNSATITPSPDGLILRSPYNAGLVQALKDQIPYSERKWDNSRKVWIVAPQHGQLLADLCQRFLNVSVAVPCMPSVQKKEQRMIRLEYLGIVKSREDGTQTATGYSSGDWSIIFPLAALKAWFEPDGQTKPGEAATLYSVLSLKKDANEEEIKKAYRRLAKQWHPDVCREPDASQQFQRIQGAYEVLSDPLQRKKYNAGLKLAASVGQAPHVAGSYNWTVDNYRSPLRCGWVLAEGVPSLGRFIVERVLAWEDITNDFGQSLVTWWNVDKQRIESEWN